MEIGFDDFTGLCRVFRSVDMRDQAEMAQALDKWPEKL